MASLLPWACSDDPRYGSRVGVPSSVHSSTAQRRTNGMTKADDVFTAMSMQRLRLRQDQQVPEWEPARQDAEG